LDDALLVTVANNTDDAIDMSDGLVYGIQQPLMRPKYSEEAAPRLYHREVMKVFWGWIRRGTRLMFGYLK
jgi:hypothetical protein